MPGRRRHLLIAGVSTRALAASAARAGHRVTAADAFAVPETRASPPDARCLGRGWLLKPRRSGGGHGTRAWYPGATVSRRSYVQERIPGPSGSIMFLADGRRTVSLGLSRQLVGDPAFGTH